MAQIVPFAGIHFDPTLVPLAEVIAPPYDVLSPAQQEKLEALACFEASELLRTVRAARTGARVAARVASFVAREE